MKKAKQLEFTQNNNQMLDDLFDELNQLPSLKNKILKHEIAYIFGIIFMDMSSIHVFGYHVGAENIAFARFRVLGAYWLSKSICLSDDQWMDDEKLAISTEIKQAVLSTECSGQIINKLYGQYCKQKLKNIYNKTIAILHAKAVYT